MQPFSQKYNEKRDHIRIQMDCPVMLKSMDGAEKTMGTCVNLSASGILFQSNSDYSPGERLWIHVEPKLKVSPGLSALVEIVRHEFLPQSRSYNLAARIKEIH